MQEIAYSLSRAGAGRTTPLAARGGSSRIGVTAALVAALLAGCDLLPQRKAAAIYDPPLDPSACPRSTTVPDDLCPEIAPPRGDVLSQMLQLRATDRFAELEARLEAYDRAYTQNVLCEMHAWTAYEGVADVRDPSSAAALDRWVEARPGSRTPHRLRAALQTHLGFEARGTKFAHETPEESFARMREHFRKAFDDVTALGVPSPPHMLDVDIVLDITRATGQTDRAMPWVAELLRREPLNYGVRRRLMMAYEPRWGGSIDAMEALGRDAGRLAGENYRLGILRGFSHAYRAEMAYRDERYDAAVAHYGAALRFGDFGNDWLTWRARAYARTKRYAHAHADLSCAKQIKPEDAEVWSTKGWLYNKQNQWQAAVTELDRAVELDPDDPWTHEQRGWAHEQLGHFQAAAQDLEAALAREPRRSWASFRLGTLLLEHLGRPRDALAPLRIAAELAPDREERWFRLAEAQSAVGDPGAAASYRRFLDLADASAPSSRAHIERARRALDPNASPPATETAEEPMPGLSLLEP